MAGTDSAGTVEPGSDAPVPVPSGQAVTLIEVIWDSPGPEGLAARFRFLAPAIARDGGTIGPEAAGADIVALCRDVALARIAARGGEPPAEIIVSLSDRVLPFGESHPEATQYFDSFTLQDGACVPSLF